VAHDPQALEGFRREAKSASALNHPNICTIYDIGEDGGGCFPGHKIPRRETLKLRIANKPLPFDEILDLGVQITEALDAAHACGSDTSDVVRFTDTTR
jgi:serine/threonine protein kinase